MGLLKDIAIVTGPRAFGQHFPLKQKIPAPLSHISRLFLSSCLRHFRTVLFLLIELTVAAARLNLQVLHLPWQIIPPLSPVETKGRRSWKTAQSTNTHVSGMSFYWAQVFTSVKFNMLIIDVLLCQYMNCMLSFVFNALMYFIKSFYGMLYHVTHNAIEG